MKLLKFEILGIFFISLLGSFLHFTFQLSHKFWLVGIFSAVNESTWEHLKLAVIPAILWAILESRVFKLKANNLLCAKAAGIWLMPVLIVVFFYGYKAILGYHNLALDIGIFILAVKYFKAGDGRSLDNLASTQNQGFPSTATKKSTSRFSISRR